MMNNANSSLIDLPSGTPPICRACVVKGLHCPLASPHGIERITLRKGAEIKAIRFTGCTYKDQSGENPREPGYDNIARFRLLYCEKYSERKCDEVHILCSEIVSIEPKVYPASLFDF